MSDDLYTLVGYQVEATADWRRRQAEYFPGNGQNTRAAKELERLAAEIEQLEGSSVHKQIRLATDGLKNEDWFAMSESVYSELRSVGLTDYESGLRFLEWYCDRLRGDPPRCLKRTRRANQVTILGAHPVEFTLKSGRRAAPSVRSTSLAIGADDLDARGRSPMCHQRTRPSLGGGAGGRSLGFILTV
jgi:hypothetical protein